MDQFRRSDSGLSSLSQLIANSDSKCADPTRRDFSLHRRYFFLLLPFVPPLTSIINLTDEDFVMDIPTIGWKTGCSRRGSAERACARE